MNNQTHRVNLVIATWSGGRYNPSKDYLKVLIKRLFELKHNLDQVTIVIPEGSWNEDYYDIGSLIPESYKNKVAFIRRPANDRSYGQFIFAYQQFTDQFSHYIICEDDYIPNIDHFDTILVDLIEKKGVDYLCGKYAKQTKSDRDRAIMNQGIVKASAFKMMLEKCSPVFPVMGPEDGTEQLIFSEYFTNNGMTIGDYSYDYSVPYWAKTLMYFSTRRGFNTIFVPYQCVAKDIPAHFLSTIKYTTQERKYLPFIAEMEKLFPDLVINKDVFVIEEPQIDLYPHNNIEIPLGLFKLRRDDKGVLCMFCYLYIGRDAQIAIDMYERVSWENRGENLHIWVNIESDIFTKIKDLKWVECENVMGTYIKLFKDYRNW